MPRVVYPVVLLSLFCSFVTAGAQQVEPTPGFDARRAGLLQRAGGDDTDAFQALLCLAAQRRLSDAACSNTIDTMDRRQDCADFGAQGLLRLMYQFGDSPLVSSDLKNRIRKCILEFKYWPDEPGLDSMCSWSENHQILFSTAGYLAGQLYPDVAFTNSKFTGAQQMDRQRPRIKRWLDFRFKTGFSEWLSNVYYEEDIAALLNLADFAQDEEISKGAAMVLDLLLADIALNSYRGVFGSTHGRSYEAHKKWAAQESTADVYQLLFGAFDSIQVGGGMGPISLALSPKYRVPRVLYEIANDQERQTLLNRQRMGIKIEDAEKWGLRFDNFEDGMFFLSMEAYCHPRMINLFMDMLDEYGWWQNNFFSDFAAEKASLKFAKNMRLLPAMAWLFRQDITRNMRPEVNIYTYRTPAYMLSSAQAYRRGFGGDQQHIWQATLGPDAVCFTTHPVKEDGESPSYWTGSGSLPRVGQVNNVAIILYDLPQGPALYVKNALKFTHAWLPSDKFDEVVEKAPWTFARKGDGYFALYSNKRAHWRKKKDGDVVNNELIARGMQSAWVCEMGCKRDNGSFQSFMDSISKARLRVKDLQVEYFSPSQGRLKFGWNGPLIKNGWPVQLRNYARYDNPYAQVKFPADTALFELNGHFLKLDWKNKQREFSN